MNFDWYAASVDVEPDEALGWAAYYAEHVSAEGQPVRGRHGYAGAMSFANSRGRVLDVMWANRGAPNSGCFFEASGKWAEPVAQSLRAKWPVHRVARADVAEDFAGDGTWDRLSGLVLGVADDHNIKVEHAGDHHRALDGRSLYIGGRGAVTRVVCYEKGIESGGDPTQVRIELRARPGDRAAKFLAAATAPPEFYGASAWTRDLRVRLGHPEVSRLSLGTVYRDEDQDRARRFLLMQYGPTLRGLERDLGGWDEVGRWIGAELAKPKVR